MNSLAMSWEIEDGQLVCRWNELKHWPGETAILTEAQHPESWNSDIVFELGDAA
ncbi:MAG TPA: hypothetical protein VK670_09865 [Silvibacterium sp.]|nr:hypothetical protein [Silvibacterium sp.]